MRIRDIMTRPAVVCGRHETLNGAARMMWEHDCGVVPVVDDEGRVVGILTDRDICMAAYTQGKSLAGIPVAEAMSRDVVSCRPGDFLESTIRVMADRQVRRLPVLDGDGRPVGMVSFSDLVRHASTVVQGEDVDYDVVKGFAALSRPRREIAAPADPPQARAATSRSIPRARRPPRATA